MEQQKPLMQEMAEARTRGSTDDCVLFLHLGRNVSQEKSAADLFRLFFLPPTEYRSGYLVSQGHGNEESFETNDFGQAMDWLLKKWLKLEKKYSAVEDIRI